MCKKRKYRDELGAKIALAKIINSANSMHEEKRHYYCPRCRGWHLTSKDPSPRYKN